MNALLSLLDRIPILLLTFAAAAWYGYDYYAWLHAPDSELNLKAQSLVQTQNELSIAQKKLASGEEFYKNLDVLRSQIRALTAQLDSTKAVLSSEIDIANFVRMLTLEAKKLNLVIKSIKPEPETKREYYIEVPFTLQLRGAYVQLLVFFDRIARFNQVIRISDFEMRPSGNAMTKYVELSGSVKLVAYKYLGTAADEVVHKAEMKEATPTPGNVEKPQ